MKTYLPSLDGLRLVAVLLVFVHHHPLLRDAYPVAFLQREGWLGVDLFLALSAYLFARLLALEHAVAGRIDTIRFYVRRILRIWPAYFAYVAACVVLHLAFPGGSHPLPWHRIATLATFTDDIATAFQDFNPIFGTAHLWTISYEEQFYLALPPVLWLFAQLRRTGRVVLAITLVALGLALKALAIHVGPGQPAVWVLPFTHFESVALGALLGLGKLEAILRRLPAWAPPVLGLSGYALLCALPPDDLATDWLFAKYLVSGLVAVLWIQSALTCTPLRDRLSHPLAVHLGKRSYGLYLYHGVAIVVADALLRRGFGLERFGLASFLLAPPLAWIAAYISYRWLESPFLRWKRRFETVHSRPV